MGRGIKSSAHMCSTVTGIMAEGDGRRMLVTCSRCGARLSSYLCPRCDSRQSPSKIPFFSDGLMIPVSTPTVDHLVKSLARKMRGAYRHFPIESQWEPGETELYRGELEGIRIFTVDGYTHSGRPAACILTDQVLMLHDRWSGLVRVPLVDIQAVTVYRDIDAINGASCRVSIRLIGGAVHEPRGDICLVCKHQGQSYHMTQLIQEAAQTRRSVRSAPL
jgi:hypothetical protein